MEIREATTASELNHLRTLARAFIVWLQQTYPEAHDSFAQDFTTIETDFASLDGAFGSPKGKALVGYQDGEMMGMVALQDRGHICEMKYMFVNSEHRSKGIGRALAVALIEAARMQGYSRMHLSTGSRQAAALGLYRSLGFQEISPYHRIPESLQSFLVFMELRL